MTVTQYVMHTPPFPSKVKMVFIVFNIFTHFYVESFSAYIMLMFMLNALCKTIHPYGRENTLISYSFLFFTFFHFSGGGWKIIKITRSTQNFMAHIYMHYKPYLS